MLNISILSFSASLLFYSKSPLFVHDNFTLMSCNFHYFSSIVFYNAKYLQIKNSKFNNGLANVIFNGANAHETFQKMQYNSPLLIKIDQQKAVSVINCLFSNITGSNPIEIKEGSLSLYITSSTFIYCNTPNSVIFLQKVRCFTMTHVCTYNCGSSNEAAIVNHDIDKEDFGLFLYSTFFDSYSQGGGQGVFVIKNGNQYYRCNNFTKSNFRALSINNPLCFSFALSTIVDVDTNCFQLSGNGGTFAQKTIEMSNLLCNGQHLIEIAYQYELELHLVNCVLLSNHKDPKLVMTITYHDHKILVQNCILLNSYLNEENAIVSFTDCISVDYDLKYITKYAHYTDGEYCDGEGNADENIQGCESGNCVDSLCGKTIGFPNGVIPYTTFCPECTETAEFSRSEKFSESKKFSESIKFSYSKKFTDSDKFSYSKKFSESVKFSYSKKFTESVKFSDSNEFSESMKFASLTVTPETSYIEKAFDPNNQGTTEKGVNKAMIGAISGVVAAVIIAVVITIVVVMKKRKQMNVSTNADVVESKDSFTTKNNLNTEMKEDDPFADEFNDDIAPNGDLVL